MSEQQQTATEHERVLSSLLARPERAFIQWFLSRAPAGVTPDHLTAVGLAGSLLILAGYALSNRAPGFLWLANLGFMINWFGDSADGNLARYRRIERPRYGFFLDHAVDSISMLVVFFGLGISPYVSLEFALFGLAAYLLMSIFVYLDTLVNKMFQISFGWFGPTEGRALLVILNLLMMAFGRPLVRTGWGAFYLYDAVIGVGGAVLFCTYAAMVVGRLRRLAVQDPPRPSSGVGSRNP